MRYRLVELLDEADKMHDTKQCEGCAFIGHGDKCVKHFVADHLLANGVVILDPKKYPPVTNRKIIETIMGVPLDEVAELIEAKQEGRIIVPPCKVGDTVYAVRWSNALQKTVVTPYIVDELFYSTDRGVRPWIVICFGGKRFDNTDFGKTVFLTKSEAERALERRAEQ